MLRDRRLRRCEKLAILEAWELEARALSVASEENMSGGELTLLEEVVKARVELGDETDPDGRRRSPDQGRHAQGKADG